MKSKKVTSYVLYALGEIILVVIGILIAIQIDDYYQNLKIRKLEVKYLKELRESIEFDLADINFNIEFNQDRFQSNLVVLNHLKNDLPYHDSLDFHFSNLVYSTRTLPNVSAFKSLESKGLEIISNDSLRILITALYSFEYVNIQGFEQSDDHKFQYNILWPEFISTIEIDSVGGSAKPINYSELKKNIKFKNIISSNLTYRKYMINEYLDLKRNVKKLIREIDKELLNLEY